MEFEIKVKYIRGNLPNMQSKSKMVKRYIHIEKKVGLRNVRLKFV